jgi:hypothetical protein
MKLAVEDNQFDSLNDMNLINVISMQLLSIRATIEQMILQQILQM